MYMHLSSIFLSTTTISAKYRLVNSLIIPLFKRSLSSYLIQIWSFWSKGRLLLNTGCLSKSWIVCWIMLVQPNSFIFSNWMFLYSLRIVLKSEWLGPSCMTLTVTLLLMASAKLYKVKRLSSSISISSSYFRSIFSCWRDMIERNLLFWSSFITSMISFTILDSLTCHLKAFSMAISGSGRSHFSTTLLML